MLDPREVERARQLAICDQVNASHSAQYGRLRVGMLISASLTLALLFLGLAAFVLR